MKKFVNQDDVIHVLNQKTGFFKKDLRVVMDALEENDGKLRDFINNRSNL